MIKKKWIFDTWYVYIQYLAIGLTYPMWNGWKKKGGDIP